MTKNRFPQDILVTYITIKMAVFNTLWRLHASSMLVLNRILSFRPQATRFVSHKFIVGKPHMKISVEMVLNYNLYCTSFISFGEMYFDINVHRGVKNAVDRVWNHI